MIGDRFVRLTLAAELDDELLHLGEAGQVYRCPHTHRNLEGGGCAPLPDDARLHLVGSGALENDLIDQAAQKRFLVGGGQNLGLIPDLGELLTDGSQGVLEFCWQRSWCGCGLQLERKGFFGLLKRYQGGLPAPFQFCGYQPVIRIDLIVLTLGQGGLIAQALELLLLSVSAFLIGCALGLEGLLIGIQLNGGESLEEGLHHLFIHGVGGDALTDWDATCLSQVVAQVVMAPFVLNHQLVSALATIHDTLQQHCPWARHAAGLVTIILGIIVSQHRLDAHKGFPVEVSRIFVVDDDFHCSMGNDRVVALPCRSREVQLRP